MVYEMSYYAENLSRIFLTNLTKHEEEKKITKRVEKLSMKYKIKQFQLLSLWT